MCNISDRSVSFFSACMNIHLSSLILLNISLLFNNLDKIEFKIEDEDQALLLLCSLPSSYKRFREAIYGGKSIIKVNEVKKYLLNKDKIDKQLTGESHRDDSRQTHFTKKKSNNESSTSNSNIRIWCTSGVIRRGTLELII